ncbi:hypothetical protein [Curtobacterium sp. MCSS17_016]|uniref:hypothetical protein n=1 Tax=Curtobacterium sp. MCSS17_016 TaxID=2175644 RepID=UPI000DA6EAC8|nr:hypothetical protein [Curtobacterium sp. MCSS17_016]WIE81519.1 hypothetical protein DEJ19_019980 [Curtobacterium sp. MCSS17_016]
MSGADAVDDELWAEYVRLLRAVNGDGSADEVARNGNLRSFAEANPAWLGKQMERLRTLETKALVVAGDEQLMVLLWQRRYAEAARLLPGALTYFSSWLSNQEAVPAGPFDALSPAALAAAALHPEEETDALLAKISEAPNSPAVGAHSRVLTLRDNMKAVLAAAAESADRASVKAASRLDGRAFSNTVQWLVKAGVLTDDGKTLRPATDAPATAPPTEQTPIPSGFRLSDEEPLLIDLNTHPRVAGPDMYDSPQFSVALSRVPEPAPTFLPTPQMLRPAGQARMLGTKHTTWLLTMKRPVAEFRSVWTAAVFNRDGKPQATVPLPAPVKSWTVGADRDWVCLLDEDEHLRVYREGGELIVDVNLVGVYDGNQNALEYPLRADYDVTDDRLLMSAGSHLWLLHPDGSGWGRRMPPKVFPSGAWPRGATPAKVRRLAKQLRLREDLTTSEAVSHLAAIDLTERSVAVRWSSDAGKPAHLRLAASLHDELGVITDDSIYEARLTRDGVTVSTAYGLNADVTTAGEVSRLWTTVGSMTTLGEAAGGRVGVTADAVVSVTDSILTVGPPSDGTTVARSEASPTPVHETAGARGEPLPLPNHIVRVTGGSVHIVNTSTGTARTYPVPKKPSAVVRAGDHLRIHVGAKHAEVPLP